MTKFKSILSDEEHFDINVQVNIIYLRDKEVNDRLLHGRLVEQAVLAKLAEQEPILYISDKVLNTATGRIDPTAKNALTWSRNSCQSWSVPLYAHPFQINGLADGTLIHEGTKGQHRSIENHIPDAGKMIEHESHSLEFEVRTMVEMLEAKEWADHSGQSALGKRLEVVISTLHNELYEAQAKRSKPELAKNQPCGCVVCYCENQDQCQGCGAKSCGTHEVGEIPNPIYADHIPDAGKMIPEGWQLVPKEPTEDMYLGFCHVRNDIEPDEFREACRAMLAAAPKYDGGRHD